MEKKNKMFTHSQEKHIRIGKIKVITAVLVLAAVAAGYASECSRDDDCGGDMECSDGWCVDGAREAFVYEGIPMDEFHIGIALVLPVPLGDFADGAVEHSQWNNNQRDLLKGTSSLLGYGLGMNLYFPVVTDLYLGLRTLALENRTDAREITRFNGDTAYTKSGSWYNISFLPSIQYMPNLSPSFEIYVSAQAGLNLALPPNFKLGLQTVDEKGNLSTSRTDVNLNGPAYTFAAGGGVGIRIAEGLNFGVSFLHLGVPEFDAEVVSGTGSADQYKSSKPLMMLLVTAGIDF